MADGLGKILTGAHVILLVSICSIGSWRGLKNEKLSKYSLKTKKAER